MTRTIKLSEELVSQIDALAAERGEAGDDYAVTVLTAAIARDMALRESKATTGRTMRDRLAGRIGRVRGGGNTWSEIEAPCDPH